MSPLFLSIAWCTTVLILCVPSVNAVLPAATLLENLDFELEAGSFGAQNDKTCPTKVEYNGFRSQVITLGTVDSGASAFETPGGSCTGGSVIFSQPKRTSDLPTELVALGEEDSVFSNILFGDFTSDISCRPGNSAVGSSTFSFGDKFSSALFVRPGDDVVRVSFRLTLYSSKLYLFLSSDSARRRTGPSAFSRDPCVYSVRAPTSSTTVSTSSPTSSTPATVLTSQNVPIVSKAPSSSDSSSSKRDKSEDKSPGTGLGAKEIGGIAAGAIGIIAILVGAIICWRRRK